MLVAFPHGGTSARSRGSRYSYQGSNICSGDHPCQTFKGSWSKTRGEEYEIYIQFNDAILEVPEDEPGYRDTLPTVDLQKVHNTIRGYAKYAIGAFRNFEAADIEKITLKLNLKIAGKAGIPMLTEGSAESNFEIQGECKFPSQPKPG